MAEARDIAVEIVRPAVEVGRWLAEPTNWPLWASGLGKGLRREADGWVADGPEGPVRIRFAAPNRDGVFDHDVTLADGTVISVPLRVLPDGEGAKVILTLIRQPTMTDEVYERDAAWVRRDLDRLKAVLEQEPKDEGRS